MNVSIGPRWENFVSTLVEAGRYGTGSEVVREGLRLVEEREAKLQALRDTLSRSIERGGSHSSNDVLQSVDDTLDAWEQARRS